jgi:hypothetical protein
VSRLRHDLPCELKCLQENNLSIDVVQIIALETVPLCRAASAECHWTRLAYSGYPAGFNGLSTYGPPSRTRNRYGRFLTDQTKTRLHFLPALQDARLTSFSRGMLVGQHISQSHIPYIRKIPRKDCGHCLHDGPVEIAMIESVYFMHSCISSPSS